MSELSGRRWLLRQETLGLSSPQGMGHSKRKHSRNTTDKMVFITHKTKRTIQFLIQKEYLL